MSTPTQKPNQPKTALLVIGVIAMVALLLSVLSSNKNDFEDLKWYDFKAALENPAREQDRVVEATIQGNSIMGIRQDRSKVKTFVPYDDSIRKLFEESGVQITFLEPESENLMNSLFVNLPYYIMALLLAYFLYRSLQAGGGKAMSFGKSKASLLPLAVPLPD